MAYKLVSLLNQSTLVVIAYFSIIQAATGSIPAVTSDGCKNPRGGCEVIGSEEFEPRSQQAAP